MLCRAPYIQIARVLRNQYGWSTFGFESQKASTHIVDGMTETLDLFHVVESSIKAPIPDNLMDRCVAIEDEYDLNLADLIVPDRHMGRNWIIGGMYPKSRLSSLPYEKHLQIICDVLEACNDFLVRIKPDFVCPGSVGSFQIAAMFAACKKNQIPIQSVSEAIFHLYYYWKQDRTALIPGLESVYCQMKNDPNLSITRFPKIVSPQMDKLKNSYLKMGSWGFLLRKIWRMFFRLAMSKGRTISTGNILFTSKVSLAIKKHSNFRKELKRSYSNLDSMGDYVYFPLHFEPEATLNGREPYFSNQLYAVEMLSKSVPTGVNVLVKEHWAAVGTRPDNWMDKISEFPRVAIVSPLEDSIDIINRCMATATISGTAGLEAAVLGKPVISLGPSYRFNFVDHVWYVSDIPSIRERLRWIFNNKIQMDFSKNGEILKHALDEVCFKVNGMILDTEHPSEDDAKTACEVLMGKLMINDQN